MHSIKLHGTCTNVCTVYGCVARTTQSVATSTMVRIRAFCACTLRSPRQHRNVLPQAQASLNCHLFIHPGAPRDSSPRDHGEQFVMLDRKSNHCLQVTDCNKLTVCCGKMTEPACAPLQTSPAWRRISGSAVFAFCMRTCGQAM